LVDGPDAEHYGKNHHASIMRKLGVRRSLELICYAAKVGIIDIEL
jgi:DNA-binding CsgD family transcriptional regulator